MKKKPILVTKPSLPKLSELIPYLEQVWDSEIVTNNGPIHNQFEDALSKYLQVPHASLFSNGTIGLMIALKALKIEGEVITTPYSYVASAHSLMWNNIKPVFADIDPITLNLDPEEIEKLITSKTKAIMPIHVYGNPCDVENIDRIAKKYNLKVIYDAAHAFGVNDQYGSILNYGDLSVLSFHGTKVFNTFEGGAVISHDENTKKLIDGLKNYGFKGEDKTSIDQLGINGKMNEFNSALGLLQLEYIDNEIAKRKQIDTTYRQRLEGITGIRCFEYSNISKGNYSYFPIFVEDDYPLTRDQLFSKLKDQDIIARRYFYPLITEFSLYRDFINQNDKLPIANKATNSVICLPIYPNMQIDQVDIISNIIRSI